MLEGATGKKGWAFPEWRGENGLREGKRHQQLLDIWKNADADFIPAREARRELAVLATH